MINYQHYPFNLTHDHTRNNLILNTKIKIKIKIKIGIRIYFSFTMHHIVQCNIKLFFKKYNKSLDKLH